MKKFPERLVSLRKESSMTQEDLARSIGCKRSTVSGYETEGKEPDFNTLCFLAEFFGVSTDYLLGRDEERRHADVVFRNNDANFKRRYDALSPELKPVVVDIFNDVYILLSREMNNGRSQRLVHYRELMNELQCSRGDIRQHIESGTISDPVFMSSLMGLQNDLKSKVSSTLDKIMQADLDYVLGINNKKGESSAGKTA